MLHDASEDGDVRETIQKGWYSITIIMVYFAILDWSLCMLPGYITDELKTRVTF